jgi:hypothetical protein
MIYKLAMILQFIRTVKQGISDKQYRSGLRSHIELKSNKLLRFFHNDVTPKISKFFFIFSTSLFVHFFTKGELFI